VIARTPKSLQTREQEIKEIVRERLIRGKINVNISIEKETAGEIPVTFDLPLARSYAEMLNELRRAAGIEQELQLQTLLTFSDIIKVPESDATSEAEWRLAKEALDAAIVQIQTMRRNEGGMIDQDLRKRIDLLEGYLGKIEELSRDRRLIEKEKLQERIAALISSDKIDPQRLELEIALLADKLDITEECVRFRSHLHFFLATLGEEESGGRKLNFLLQEMNREANTIGSKSFDAEIAHIVVDMKDEIERIREQIQNIE
jgi:uncharacterized protein (TIGR00255 family)